MAVPDRPPQRITSPSIEPLRNQTLPESLPRHTIPATVSDTLAGDGRVIISGESSHPLVGAVKNEFAKTVINPITVFSNDESRVTLFDTHDPKQTFASQDSVIIQPTWPSPDTGLMRLWFMAQALKNAGATSVTALVPHLAYSRQDRMDVRGTVVSAKFVADVTRFAEVDRLLTIDLHSDTPYQGEDTIPWANLDSKHVLLPALVEELRKDKRVTEDFSNVTIASPDHGALKRARGYADALGVGEPAVINKQRPTDLMNVSFAQGMEGDVMGKIVILPDDIIDSAGSICNAAQLIKDAGAVSIWVVATHGLFTNDALDKIAHSAIDHVFVTDTVDPREEVAQHPKIHVVSAGPLVIETLKRLETKQPLTELTLSMSPDFEESYMKFQTTPAEESN